VEEAGPGAAHAGLSCVSCHVGATHFPHDSAAATPIACTRCHAAVSAALAGVHASGRSRVDCVECHGAHGVKTVAWLRTAEGRAAVTEACGRCHRSQLPRAGDVHAGRAACADCHGAHAVAPVQDPKTHGIALATARRCAACHANEAASWLADAHGTRAVRDAGKNAGDSAATSSGAAAHGAVGRSAGGAKEAGGASSTASGATCVDCPRGHAVRNPADTAAHFAFAETCTRCHAAYGATFRENYHGQATQVGSERAALCADCHTAHRVYPASDPRSSVAPANRLATCRRCHPSAAGRFADYRPHADPRSGSPGLFAVWLLMTVLLGAVTLVYVVHAALVSRRTLIERRSKP